jgi:hypothetical protein
MGVNLGTQLYGIALLNLGRLSGFRHILSPSIGYTFSPERKDGEKYVSAGTASSGNREQYQKITLGAGNTFQVKIAGDPDAENPQDRTISLFNLNVGTGYNFTAKDSKGNRKGRWDDLSSSATTNLYSLRLSYSGTHTFYDENGEFIPTKKGLSPAERLPKLRQYRLSAGTGANLSGKFSNGRVRVDLAGRDSVPMNPWGLNLSFNYTYSKHYNTMFKVFETSSSFSLRDNFSLTFSDHWKMSYSSIYDFQDNELVDQTINLRRDFHCWEAVFDWVLSGYRSGYYLRINVKEIPDVKVERRGGQMGSYMGGGPGWW